MSSAQVWISSRASVLPLLLSSLPAGIQQCGLLVGSSLMHGSLGVTHPHPYYLQHLPQVLILHAAAAAAAAWLLMLIVLPWEDVTSQGAQQHLSSTK